MWPCYRQLAVAVILTKLTNFYYELLYTLNLKGKAYITQ